MWWSHHETRPARTGHNHLRILWKYNALIILAFYNHKKAAHDAAFIIINFFRIPLESERYVLRPLNTSPGGHFRLEHEPVNLDNPPRLKQSGREGIPGKHNLGLSHQP